MALQNSSNIWEDGIGDLNFLSTEIMEQFRPSGKMFVQELQETFPYIVHYKI